MNRWNIPAALEQEILLRDVSCVYCRVQFGSLSAPRGQRPSWEHIVNDARIVTAANLVRCCVSCNASKGAKDLRVWLESAYCKRKGISEGTVAQVVRDALCNPLSL